MLRRMILGLGLAALVLAMAVPGLASEPTTSSGSISQPTELLPPDGDVPVLYPPDHPLPGQARIVMLIEDVPVVVAWSQLSGIAHDLGAWVSSSTSGVGTHDRVEYNYATTVVEVPDHVVGDFLAMLDELGRQVSFDLETLDPGGLTVVVTLTDLAEPFTGTAASTGRIDRALATAGDVLLTMLSVLIVAGAVFVPLALMALVVFGVWRWSRRRWPIAEPSMSESVEAEVGA